MKTYRVVLEPVEDGYWMASVPAVQGCRTQGKSVAQARRRIRDALSLFVDDAEKAELDFDMELPKALRKEVQAYHDKMDAAKRAQDAANDAGITIARRVSGQYHMTVRETAAVLGVSHQLVHQRLHQGNKATAGYKRRPK